MNEANKQKIKDNVQRCFIEKIENTIKEKISYCIAQGMTEDEASLTVTQAIENLFDALLPLKSKISVQNNEWS